MAFQIIVKRSFGSSSTPDNIVRVTKSGLIIAPNIAERFQANRKTTDNGRETVSVGLAIDVDEKKIQLIANPVNGFVFATSLQGKSLTAPQPRGFRAAGLPMGDYVLEDNEQLVFALAE